MLAKIDQGANEQPVPAENAPFIIKVCHAVTMSINALMVAVIKGELAFHNVDKFVLAYAQSLHQHEGDVRRAQAQAP